MTKLQQIHWDLYTNYIWHPYYVSGNAVYHTLTSDLDYETTRQTKVSHGIFAPGDYGTTPRDTQSGMRPYLGASLSDVEVCYDLFLLH